jgi:glycosyltransferase involved in cell wall biosynthesis
MTRDVTVSVVTPSYNQSQFIAETLSSVRRQSHDSVEHVVVDGGSTDGTVELLEARDETIRWVSEDDDGQSDAINKGFDMSTGEIVGWLNSDDVYFDTTVLERVVEYFEQTDADVLYGDMALISAASEVLKLQLVPDFDYEKLLRYCFIEQPSLFFRREVLEDERLNTELDYVMDYEFWLRLAQDYTFLHVSDVFSGDRNHANRKILNDRDRMQAEGREMTRRFGAPDHSSLSHRIGRFRDVVTSGIPRRAAAVPRTIRLHMDPPTLAFDGELRPLHEMLRNVAIDNSSLVDTQD